MRRTGSSGSLSEAREHRMDEVIEIDDDEDDDILPAPIAFDDPVNLSDPWDSDEGILVVDMSTRDPTPITSPEYSPVASPRLNARWMTPEKHLPDIDDLPRDINDNSMDIDDPWDDAEAYLHIEPAASYTTPVHTPPSSPSLPGMSPVKLGDFSPRKRSPSTTSTSSIPLAISTRSPKKGPTTPKRKATSPPTKGTPSKRASPFKPSSSRVPDSSSRPSPTKPSTSSPKKPAATTRKPRTKAPKPPKDPEPTFDDAWAGRIRGLITADRALHLRILRYEVSFLVLL